MLGVHIDKNNRKEKRYLKKSIKVKKSVHRRRQKFRKHRELSSRHTELIISKTANRKKIDASNQIISHTKEVDDEVKLKIKELKQKITTENPFDFIEYVEKLKVDNEVDLGLYLELPEETKIVYNQTPVNTLIEDMKKLRNGFFTNGYFSLGDEGEIDANRLF